MRLKVLGTQSPFATLGHNCPGFLVECSGINVMLDCGSGTHSFLNYPEDLNKLYVFLTHLHRDHISDIFNILYAAYVFHYQNRLVDPVKVYLPGSPNNIARNIVEEQISYARFSTIQDYLVVQISNLQVSFCKTVHPYETYAIKVKSSSGKSIVYTSDTSYQDNTNLVNFARNADLLISESTLLHDCPETSMHMTARQAASIASMANVKHLMLTHFSPETDTSEYLEEAKAVFEPITIAAEGMVIEI